MQKNVQQLIRSRRLRRVFAQPIAIALFHRHAQALQLLTMLLIERSCHVTPKLVIPCTYTDHPVMVIPSIRIVIPLDQSDPLQPDRQLLPIRDQVNECFQLRLRHCMEEPFSGTIFFKQQMIRGVVPNTGCWIMAVLFLNPSINDLWCRSASA